MKLRMIFSGLAFALLMGRAAYAQEPVKGAADPDALFHDKNKKLDAEKQVAYHIQKDLLQCNHWDEAGKWLTEEYHQHNPQVQSGLAPVVKAFGSRPKTATCDKLTVPVFAVVADGDLVTVLSARTLKDKNGQEYTSTWFDTWRIKNGKADEHWDPATKN
ncbi:MAG: nuclear transport factor 2 family protein [Acidobacteriia bacterium]|nr:nuclear transport factor 2 family protein [Terriglobia bacterium]MBV9742799.1 nuclear transport factor 2 family protein [Terriglobia bacterium]